MKKLITATTIAFTLAIGAQVHADDVGPDKAVELVEQGAIKHFKELNKIAQDLHPNGEIVDSELENHYGKYVYNLEIRDANRAEWDVHIDAQSGEVLKNRQDND